MKKTKHAPEQIVKKLREAEVQLARGATVAIAAKKLGVTEQTYYRWKREFGSMDVNHLSRLKELEGMTGLIARGRLVSEIVGRAMTGEIARAVSGAGVDLPARPGE